MQDASHTIGEIRRPIAPPARLAHESGCSWAWIAGHRLESERENVKLRPKLLSTLKPGTRIVSHAFDMGDWKPEQELTIEGQRVLFWTIPQSGALPR